MIEITDEMAIAIIEEAREAGAWSSAIPKTERERIEAATQTIVFAIDARIEENIRPDDEDKTIAEAGQQILSMLELANIYATSDDELRKMAQELQTQPLPELSSSNSMKAVDRIVMRIENLPTFKRADSASELPAVDRDAVLKIIRFHLG